MEFVTENIFEFELGSMTFTNVFHFQPIRVVNFYIDLFRKICVGVIYESEEPYVSLGKVARYEYGNFL